MIPGAGATFVLMTECESGALVLPVQEESPEDPPLYVAVNEWIPTANVEIAHWAAFPVSGTAVHEAIATRLSKNVTLPTPLGLPPAFVTVASNVTELPMRWDWHQRSG